MGRRSGPLRRLARRAYGGSRPTVHSIGVLFHRYFVGEDGLRPRELVGYFSTNLAIAEGTSVRGGWFASGGWTVPTLSPRYSAKECDEFLYFSSA